MASDRELNMRIESFIKALDRVAAASSKLRYECDVLRSNAQSLARALAEAREGK